MKRNLVKTFLKLVKIDSPSGNESSIRNFLLNWLKKNKFLFKVDKVGNIFAKNKAGSDSILFSAHMDTVEPGRNIKPIIKKGQIQSSTKTILGADNKAFIACLLYALEKYKGKKTIEVIFSIKEETGGGIEFFPFQWVASKRGFIFDHAKPVGGIVLRSPYIYNFHAEFRGKAAHSSTPGYGINALTAAVDSLSKIPAGMQDNDETTINIGLMKAGTGMNTIPESATFSGEVRSYSRSLFLKHLKKIESTVRNEAKKAKVITTFKKAGYCPGYTHSPSDPFIKKISKVIERIQIQPKFFGFSGISDANVLNSKGIKTVVFSDGVNSPHTARENISIDSLYKMSDIISAIIYTKW